ncbi:MAG: MMPL family transporter [Spirochaetes bacterium]|nr:MMPL family transporter [Spirochaetota bacterium]
MKLRKQIDLLFEKAGNIIYDHKLLIVFVLLIIIGLLSSQLPGIKFDTSTEGFLHKHDPTLKIYDQFKNQFGRDEIIIIAIKSEEVFSEKFIKKLKLLHDRLENEVPYLTNINSLINIRNVYGLEDELIVEDLLEDFAEKKINYPDLKKKVLSNPLYQNLIISEDGTFTTIVIETQAYQSIPGDVDEEDLLSLFAEPTINKKEKPQQVDNKIYLSDMQNSEIVDSIKKIIVDFDSKNFSVLLAGTPVMADTLKRLMLSDMRIFTALCMLVIILFLVLIFKRFTGVFLPLIVVISTLLSVFGLMAITGFPIQLPTQILPSFLLVVGVGASVHILAIFYHNLHHNLNKKDAVIMALKHSGPAIVMTSLTTAAGLFSFSTSDIAPVSSLGIFGGIGVIISLIFTIFFLPALIAILPIKQKTSHKSKKLIMDKVLLFFVHFTFNHYKKIIFVSSVIIFISFIFLFNVNFAHNPISWLPDSADLKINTYQIDKNLKGSVTVEVIIDTEKKDGIKEPELLKKIDSFSNSIKNYQSGELFVGNISTINIMIKEINQALNENNPDFYKIPHDRYLIAQELFLFESSGSDDLEKIVDSDYQMTKITIKVPMLDALSYVDFINFIEQKLEENFGNLIKIQVTGFIPLLARTLYTVVTSTARSYIIAFIVITIMMILLIGRIGIGLLSMIPNLLPVLFALSIMGIFGINLDMFVMLVGCIAIGLAVDDTIHFMHNFRKYYSKTKDVKDAIKETLLSTGRAMLTTSVVLSSGFFIFMLASMKNLFNFGMLTGIAIIVALLADFLLAPSLLMWIYQKNTQS